MVWDALGARRHGKRSGRGERRLLGEPRHALSARAERARDGGPDGRGGKRVRGGGGRRRCSDVVCAGPQRRLPRLAFGPASRPRARHWIGQLPDADARHVRELRRRALHRGRAPRPGDRANDRDGVCGAAAGTATHLPGRVRVPGVCAPGRAARPRPVHARGGGSADRRGVPVHRLALPALAVRAPLHARLLSACAARTGGRPLGAEGCRRGVEPRRGRPHGKRREQDGPLGEGGGGVRGLEPGAARAGGGRRPQRHARAAHTGGRPGACGGHGGGRVRGGRGRWGDGGSSPSCDGGSSPSCDGGSSSTRGGRRARGRRGRQGLSRTGAPFRGARAGGLARAGPCGGERARRARAAGDHGDRRLRHERVRLPRRPERATAAGRHAQHPGGDRSPGGPEWGARLVAQRVPRGTRACARVDPLAHRTRSRLARDGRLGNLGAAAIDRLATALVCDMGAAPGRPRRQPPPARRHARVLRLRHPDPPAARRPPA
jgi:hypothetical protein